MRTSISINSSTKERLQALKGRKSYDDFFDTVVNYFQNTGIDPSKMIASPTIVMKEQADRIIEVVRGIEKAQKKLFEKLSYEVNHAQFSVESDNKATQEGIEAIQILETAIKDLQKENEHLKKNGKSEKQTIKFEKSYFVNLQKTIGELLNESRFNLSGIKNDRWAYDQIFINKIVDEIHQKLEKIIELY